MAVPAPLRRAFDYVPGTLGEACLQPGMRVRVPFGRTEQVGIIIEPAREAPDPGYTCRSVLAVIDQAPLLDSALLELCRWTADYYHHPIGEVLATALPGPLRRGDSGDPMRRHSGLLRLTAAGTAATPGARSTRLLAVLAAVAAGPLTRAALLEAIPGGAAALRDAIRRGWLEACDVGAATAGQAEEPQPELTQPQLDAIAALRSAPDQYSATLLEGVTGSGKTEVYLRLAADALAQGRQVLVLAPEIGLTPQLAQRFSARFGGRVASYHSGLTDGERARSWLGAKAGTVDIIVGTRSAIFVPLARPGLIVVDEEHDPSYKQQDGLRYSARDLALVRAHRLGIPVILGSATPALESTHNAKIGRYRHVRLLRRVHAGPLPRIRLVDLRAQPLHHGISTPVLEAIERQLQGGGQSLLFLNRRGYAPALLCHDCGWVAPCPHCDARMVLHRARRRLQCHHCGHASAVPAICPECDGGLLAIGEGTERIEEALRLRFPQARVERFDSDRLAKAGELVRLLADVRAGAVDLLVGTQVLAKGHDFAGLSFAGILDVDQALYGSDFRALERMGQVVTQVAGRVGRKGQAGEVLLQTHRSDHPLLRLLLEQGYAAFSAALMEDRRNFHLPPFAHLVLLRAEARGDGAALQFLQQARQQMPAAPGVEAMGPIPSSMQRRAGFHRAQLLLRSPARGPLHRLLQTWVPLIEALRPNRQLRWSLDVDPAELY